MAKLFDVVAKSHGVTFERVRQALRHRRRSLDSAVILAFVLLFSFVASVAARRICRSYPLDDGWAAAGAMTVFVSIAGSCYYRARGRVTDKGTGRACG